MCCVMSSNDLSCALPRIIQEPRKEEEDEKGDSKNNKSWESQLCDAILADDLPSFARLLPHQQSVLHRRRLFLPGEAPLHLAAQHGRTSMVRALVESGCVDVNGVLDYGHGFRDYALHLAVASRQAETVKALLDLGADPSSRASWLCGWRATAREVAEHKSYKELVEIFEEFEKEKK